MFSSPAPAPHAPLMLCSWPEPTALRPRAGVNPATARRCPANRPCFLYRFVTFVYPPLYPARLN